MDYTEAFRRALEDGDVAATWNLWSRVAPHLPQPKSHAEAEIMMHHARTAARSVPFRARAYSHRWLSERSLPSALPDELRPKAERLHPVVVEAVLIGVKARDPARAPLARIVERAMAQRVEELYADGITDPARVSVEISTVRDLTLRGHQ